ncbi:ArnT family glycosyltransferase [Arthrobacter nitrophenolicus]|uniref:ArnT family glycosyltransferase n=1 Tax=Arthrobacter nitrophenolicus TaxID=683150 RepID=UPI0038999590
MGVNGWANAYYSAAVMSGAEDWTAFFYGSSDPGNAITVDKPPLSIWVMALSARLFGLNSWSILLPQAFMGVLTAFLLYISVRKRFGAAAGLLAATLMAVTPVSTVMFRYNNPDALLVLIMVGIALSVLKAIDAKRPVWLILAGVLVGAGFLTKQLQICLVIPALVATYLAFAQEAWLRRLLHLTLAGLAAMGIGGSWLLAVQLTDPSSRPFIGGSRGNSSLELALGYNGLGRLTGEDATRTLSGSAARLAENPEPGITRFLQPQFSGQFGWFIPFAVAGLILTVVYICTRRGATSKNALLLFSSVWLVSACGVVAYMSGILHPYYSLTAVPPLSILAAITILYLAHRSNILRFRLALAFTFASSLLLAFITASRSVQEFPGLPLLIACTGGIILALQVLPPPNITMRKISVGFLLAAILIVPLLWSVNTVINPHVGAGVIAGPSIFGIRSDHPNRVDWPVDLPPGVAVLVYGDEAPPGIVEQLEDAPESLTWPAATVGAQTAANLQLASQRSVLPIGGWDGTDPYPTLSVFQQWVAEGRVGALLIGNLPTLTQEGQGESAKIVKWVRETHRADRVDGMESYDLTQ